LLIGLFLFFVAGVLVYFNRGGPVVLGDDPQQTGRTLVFLIPTVLFLCGLFSFSIWIWALVDLLADRKLQGTDKIVWALVIILLNVLGAILYFVVFPFIRAGAIATDGEIGSDPQA
jgi:hypothetical protein